MPVAIITGGSAGLGLALAGALAARGWDLVVDARGEPALRAAAASLGPRAVAVPGDVADPAHRHALVAAAQAAGPGTGPGRLDLLVNNASTIGPSPMPRLADYPEDELLEVYQVNVLAPLALIRLALPALAAAGGTVVDITSDAAREAYPGWGGYGSAKAALEQATAVLAAELAQDQRDVHAYAFDPGDLRTDLHQRAFPGEDISDRPEPASVVPALLRLIDERPPPGRYRDADLAAPDHAAPDHAAPDHATPDHATPDHGAMMSVGGEAP
jgi:NAD(P)-dependent dehydrogenase (short-subunit alcohol dehydrogenase family)